MSESVDAKCPECSSNQTYFAPATVDKKFVGGEFQCYGCGHSEVWDL